MIQDFFSIEIGQDGEIVKENSMEKEFKKLKIGKLSSKYIEEH